MGGVFGHRGAEGSGWRWDGLELRRDRFDDDAGGRVGVARGGRGAESVVPVQAQLAGRGNQEVMKGRISRVIESRANSCGVSSGRRSVQASSSRRLSPWPVLAAGQGDRGAARHHRVIGVEQELCGGDIVEVLVEAKGVLDFAGRPLDEGALRRGRSGGGAVLIASVTTTVLARMSSLPDATVVHSR